MRSKLYCRVRILRKGGFLSGHSLGLSSLLNEQILMEGRLFMSKGEDIENPRDGSEFSRNKFYFPFCFLYGALHE